MVQGIERVTEYDEERAIQRARDVVSAREDTPLVEMSEIEVERYFLARCLVELESKLANEEKQAQWTIDRAKQEFPLETDDWHEETFVAQAVKAEQLRWQTRLENQCSIFGETDGPIATECGDSLDVMTARMQQASKWLKDNAAFPANRVKTVVEKCFGKGAITRRRLATRLVEEAIELARIERLKGDQLRGIIDRIYSISPGCGLEKSSRMVIGLLGYVTAYRRKIEHGRSKEKIAELR